jgi:hypothetical protein
MTKDLIEALKAIAALNPSDDSEEGFNEWGEADCFRQAQTIARAALALNQAPAEKLSDEQIADLWNDSKREPLSEHVHTFARALESALVPKPPANALGGEATGCACRWNAEDVRVTTCERHQGWLDVVEEWATRARTAEAALAAPPAPVAQPAAGVAEFVAKFEACKREAQQWKQEAKTANATIAEIYQLCTGKTGEPGNWNGAKPVRELIESLCAPTPEVKPEAALSDEQITAKAMMLDAPNDFKNGFIAGYKAAIAAHGKTT